MTRLRVQEQFHIPEFRESLSEYLLLSFPEKHRPVRIEFLPNPHNRLVRISHHLN